MAFELRKISIRQQPSFNILYKGNSVGLFVPDLIVFNAIVVDTKVIDRISDHERGLMFELSSNHETARRNNLEFQACQIGVGKNRPVN